MSVSNKYLGSWVKRQQLERTKQYYRSAVVAEGSIHEYSRYTPDVDSTRFSPKSHISHKSHKSHKAQLSYKRTNVDNSDVLPPLRKPRDFKDAGFFHPSRGFYRWAILILASNLLLAAYFGDECIPATVPYLKQQYNLNTQQIAILYSASFVPNLLMTILGGMLVDRYGTNKTSLLFSTFVLFGMAIFAFAPTYYGMLIGRIVFGLGFESLEVAQDTILTRWYWDDTITAPPSLTFSYGFTFSTSQLVYGQLLGSNILPTLGGMNLMLCYGVATVFCLFGSLSNIVLIYLDNKASPVLDLDEVEDEEEEFSFSALKHLPKKFWVLCCITVLSYTTILVFMAFSTDFIHTKYGIDVDLAGHINSTVYGLSIMCSPFLGWFLNKYGRLFGVQFIGILSLIAGLMVLGTTDIHPYFGLALIGIAYAFIPNTLWPSVSLVCGDEVAGTAFGGITGLNSVGLLILPYVMGWLHDKYNSYEPVCFACSGLAAVALLLSIAMFIQDRREGGWLDAGSPNPHLNDTERIPLLINKE